MAELMNAQILAQLVLLNEILEELRNDQRLLGMKLLEGVSRGLNDVEHAVSMMHGNLDQVADSLFELQMYLTPGGDPREPMPS
jgi:hypothetical protein